MPHTHPKQGLAACLILVASALGCEATRPTYGPKSDPQDTNRAPIECIQPPKRIGWFALTVGAASEVVQSNVVSSTIYPNANRAYITLHAQHASLGAVQIKLSLMDAPVGTIGELKPRDVAVSVTMPHLGLTHCGQAGSKVVVTRLDGAHIAGAGRARVMCRSQKGTKHLTLSGGFRSTSTYPQ
jgi:hypothetical protein